MKIEKTEIVMLNGEELLILEKAIDLIDMIYTNSSSQGNIEKVTGQILTLLNDFTEEVVEI